MKNMPPFLRLVRKRSIEFFSRRLHRTDFEVRFFSVSFERSNQSVNYHQAFKMLKFKRRSQVIDTTPILHESPIKKAKLIEPTIDTTPKIQSNIQSNKFEEPSKFKSIFDELDSKKDSLTRSLESLRQQVEEKLNLVVETRGKIVELHSRRLHVDDLIYIANGGQYEVRNQLNQIYNPGNKLGENANILIEEARRNHQTKFEKLKFTMIDNFEKVKAAIDRKEKELLHQIEINERTMITLKHQVDQPIEESACDESMKVVQDDPDDESKENRNTPVRADEDCVIIEDGETILVNDNLDMSSSKTPDEQDMESNKQNNHSETTQTYESDDDDKTDIDDRSFTPCQAQRPT